MKIENSLEISIITSFPSINWNHKKTDITKQSKIVTIKMIIEKKIRLIMMCFISKRDKKKQRYEVNVGWIVCTLWFVIPMPLNLSDVWLLLMLLWLLFGRSLCCMPFSLPFSFHVHFRGRSETGLSKRENERERKKRTDQKMDQKIHYD